MRRIGAVGVVGSGGRGWSRVSTTHLQGVTACNGGDALLTFAPAGTSHTSCVGTAQVRGADAQVRFGQRGMKCAGRVQVTVIVSLASRGGRGAPVRFARPALVGRYPGSQRAFGRCQKSTSLPAFPFAA